jgi:hypothetical protein
MEVERMGSAKRIAFAVLTWWPNKSFDLLR